MNKLLLILFGVFILFTNCKNDNAVSTNDDTTLKSMVTLIQHTSIGCAVCPQNGHEVVASYLNEYGSNLQVLAIHGLTTGATIDGFSLFTTEGQDLYRDMDIKALPSGLINTMSYTGVQKPSDLKLFIEEQLAIKPELKLEVEFTIQDSMAFVKLNGEVLADLTKEYPSLKVSVFLMQDNIAGPQKDTRGNHIEYNHKYVMRKAFTELYGDNLVENVHVGQQILNKEYTLNLNNANIVLYNEMDFATADLKALVFVYENDNKRIVPCAIDYLN